MCEYVAVNKKRPTELYIHQHTRLLTGARKSIGDTHERTKLRVTTRYSCCCVPCFVRVLLRERAGVVDVVLVVVVCVFSCRACSLRVAVRCWSPPPPLPPRTAEQTTLASRVLHTHQPPHSRANQTGAPAFCAYARDRVWASVIARSSIPTARRREQQEQQEHGSNAEPRGRGGDGRR